MRTATIVSLLAIPLAGCLPYTVATTARPLGRGESVRTASYYAIPNAIEVPGDSVSGPLHGVDLEYRFGLDDRSDVALRIPSGSGFVLNYKRRLGEPYTAGASGSAFVAGAGIVNWGEHAYLEATYLVSGRESDEATVYGGLRVMQVVPITRGAVHDSPTAGGFLGVRLGAWDLGLSPELGVFYDRSALDVRRGSVIFVPAISMHRGRSRVRSGEAPRPAARPRIVPRLPRLPAGP